MKRDYLKGLKIKTEDGKEINLSDEIIDSIIAENGKDIETTKAKLDKTQEIENLRNQLETVNSKVEKFDGMNIEEIQKQLETLKIEKSEFEIKSKADKEAYEKAIADQQYDFKLNEYVSGQKFTSEFTKKAYMAELKNQGFKLAEDGTLLGANEYTEKFKTENQGVFVVEAPIGEKPLPTFTTGNTDGQAMKTKMSLNDWMKAKNANPNLQLPDEF